MKIYTKTGDKGKTGLIGGTRVDKSHPRLEAYGEVDELNAHLGLLRSYPIDDKSIEALIHIQQQLFVVGSYLATDVLFSELKTRLKTDARKEIEFLENEIDCMEEQIPPMKYFVLPGGHPAPSQCHIARTVCRRAERRINAMTVNDFVDEWILIYINRLSDYLFMLSRYLSKYFDEKEISWKPDLDK
ncbi:MAG: cob(I)yrinic acid a,c-diamide adenosyltransferase [Cytophagaceae bacterium]|nr:cob(I)yrinic acid a,c-diamide adenosyltransferase [Cytophagaceae bacterium]